MAWSFGNNAIAEGLQNGTIKSEDQRWLEQVSADPEFQRLYQAAYPASGQPRQQLDGVDPRYSLNEYFKRVGLPNGKSFTTANGQPALKDRVSGWTIPLAAVAAVATLGIAAAVLAPAAGAAGASAGGGAGAAAGGAGAAGAGAGAGAGAAATSGAVMGLPAATINTAAVSSLFGAGAPAAAAAGGISAPMLAKLIEAGGSGLMAWGQQKAEGAMNERNVAVAESLNNPFRHQRDQAKTAGMLDFMERAEYSKPTFSGKTTKVGRADVPEISGGFSYERSPELRAGAGRLKRDVMSGRSAPTMTDDDNFGKTAALDLNEDPAAPQRPWTSRKRKARPSYA